MITFLPYADFKLCAKVLDWRRLGKQRVEVLAILKEPEKNHAAYRMWKGWTQALVQYGLVMCEEWISRGYDDIIRFDIHKFNNGLPVKIPGWLGSPKLHANHRSNLLGKDFEFYSKLGWTEQPLIRQYFWPHHNYYWKAYEQHSKL